MAGKKKQMQGQITRIVTEKSFGFIFGDDGQEYFFHRSAVQNTSFDLLTLQQKVTFDPSEGQKGLRAENVFA